MVLLLVAITFPLFISLLAALAILGYVVYRLINSNQSLGSTEDFFIPNPPANAAPYSPTSIPTEPLEDDPNSVPLDKFKPDFKKPIKVKYSQDGEGNTATELEET